jgi:HAMP domain-containing protein
MSIIQMLFTGGGTFLSNEFPTTGNAKPFTTVIPFVESNFLVPTGVSNITAQIWGGGGASGSCYFGTSGAGGGGGYVSGTIPVSELGINALTIRAGGGGGNPSYYEIPSDEYTTQNTSTIEFIGGNSASSAPTYNTIALRGTSFSNSSLTVTPITFVGSVSNTTVTSLTLPTTQAGDIVILASAADQNTINPPTGYQLINTNTQAASYTLSYKVMGTTPDTEITGLDSSLGTGNNERNVAHLAMVFRGVSATNPIIETTAPINNDGPDFNILLPSVTADSVGCMAVAFGFLDDVGANVTNSPTGYSPSISQIADAIPDDPTLDQATIMAAFRLLTASGVETPDRFIVDDDDNYSSFT